MSRTQRHSLPHPQANIYIYIYVYKPERVCFPDTKRPRLFPFSLYTPFPLCLFLFLSLLASKPLSLFHPLAEVSPPTALSSFLFHSLSLSVSLSACVCLLRPPPSFTVSLDPLFHRKGSDRRCHFALSQNPAREREGAILNPTTRERRSYSKSNNKREKDERDVPPLSH